MSDQVVFTKEEVAEIRTCLELGKESYVPRCTKALFILDSPRPRPKVPKEMLAEIASWTSGGLITDDRIKTNKSIASRFGFDVED